MTKIQACHLNHLMMLLQRWCASQVRVCSGDVRPRHKWRQYLLSIVYKLQSSPPPTKVHRAVNSNYHQRPSSRQYWDLCSVPVPRPPGSIRKSDVCQVWNFNSIETNSRQLKWSSLSEFPDTWCQIWDCGCEIQTIVTMWHHHAAYCHPLHHRCHGHKCPVIRAQTLSCESTTLHSQFERNPVPTSYRRIFALQLTSIPFNFL